MIRSGLILSMVGVFLAGAAANDEKKEREKFQGSWEFAALELDGAKLPAEQLKGTRWTITGDQFVVVAGAVTYKGKFQLNAAKKPKTIDLHFLDGPEKGKSSLGIYDWDGEALKLCLGLAGKERPTDFVTKPGSGHALEVLKRVKP